MDLREILSTIAGVIFLVGYIPYIWATIKRITKPSKVTWIIWAIVDIITLLAMFTEDAINGQIVGASIGATVVALLAFKYGAGGWSRLDVVCMSGALAAIAIWIFTQDVLLSILICQAVNILGAIPTIASAWKTPENENKLGWGLFFLSCVITVAVMPEISIEDSAQPITFFFIQGIILFLLFRKSRVQQA